MNKIIFLDIDGVLNVRTVERDEFGQTFNKEFVENLKYIIEQTNAKIVISSTWRYNGMTSLKKMWEKRDLSGELLDVTPNDVFAVKYFKLEFFDLVKRGHEIQLWLDKHKDEVENYVIIDDDDDMLNSQLKNYVKTSGNFKHDDSIYGFGLTRKCADKAIEILKQI